MLNFSRLEGNRIAAITTAWSFDFLKMARMGGSSTVAGSDTDSGRDFFRGGALSPRHPKD